MQRAKSIDPLIRALPNWFDVQIRNLRDQRLRRRHICIVTPAHFRSGCEFTREFFRNERLLQ